ncbi:ATP-binding cassette domain-containing protein [Paraphotobacterium marinum]|uniref:ATP-binding cassette ATPase Uup n=1 Tax=Paraphotobacterium marinum TaxID=1755811 RepID=UPI0039ED07A1
MSLIRLQSAHLAFGDAPLLNSEELNIYSKERLCLVGRNGSGKSTLLKVLMEEIKLDDGKLEKQQGIKLSKLEQDPPQSIDTSAYDFVSDGLSEIGRLLSKYHNLITNTKDIDVSNLDKLQSQIDAKDGWSIDYRIKSILESLNINPDLNLKNLSGGWKRKLALAKALVSEPDILLLDEPTNHLDIETISWLESFLLKFKGAIVFISHDRTFISKLATRIVDLDRGNLSSWPGNYDEYLAGKEDALRIEQEKNALFDKRLAQEEVWIRQGIKARRTRNEGRVRRLKALRGEFKERRKVQSNVNFTVLEALQSGKIIYEVENVNVSISDKVVIKDFSCLISRGDKIALVGKNGSGKSTLIKLLMGQVKDFEGKIKVGTNQSIAYFDQYREQLDTSKTVIENLADGKQEITIAGKTRHALGYLQDFMFTPKRALSPVSILSGGEKNRLLLAKLFTKPSNIIILDEPTNDLDIETLELLEDLILKYDGTVIIVSHDRYFLDNTVTSTWFFDGKGHISMYPGGYSDAYHQFSHIYNKQKQPSSDSNISNNIVKKKKSNNVKTKLSYKEQKELEELPKLIEELEFNQGRLQNEINSPDFFSLPSEQTKSTLDELKKIDQDLDNTYKRWEELESLKESLEKG